LEIPPSEKSLNFIYNFRMRKVVEGEVYGAQIVFVHVKIGLMMGS